MTGEQGRSALAAALFAVAIAAIVTGCGAGKSDPTVPISSLGKAAFHRRAEAICAKGRARGLRFESPADDESESEALARAIERSLLPALQGVVDRLYGLGAPAGEEERIEHFLAALQHGVDAARNLPDPTLRNVAEKLDPAGALAERNGLRACVYS